MKTNPIKRILQFWMSVCVLLLFLGIQSIGPAYALQRKDNNSDEPLPLGPTTTWLAFLGGSGLDQSASIAVDGSGNTFVVGTSSATWGNPLRPYTANTDVFVAKLSPDGNLIWNTFLGGADVDRSEAIAVDNNGNIFVTGVSKTSWGSPVRAYKAEEDVFVVSLNGSTGSLIWNTFLGANKYDASRSIVVSGSDIFVMGRSYSTWGSPVHPYSSQDAFIAKINGSNGALTWNTFLDENGNGSDLGIAISSNGHIFVTGTSIATWGNPIRGFGGGWEPYSAELDAAGNLIWNTFLGGTADEYATDTAVDSAGNVFVLMDGSQGNVIVTKVDFVTGDTAWDTYIGGNHGAAMKLDPTGNLLVTGYSDNTWGTPLNPHSGTKDGFVAQFTTGGDLIWNTFFGGNGIDYSNALAFDSNGNIFVTGSSNTTWGAPTRPFTAGTDIFAAKLFIDKTTPPQVLSIKRADANPSGNTEVNFTVTFSEAVSNVDPSDFILSATGVTGASIIGAYGYGAVYNVRVNTGTGNGSIGVNVIDDDSIVDAFSNKLGGSGTGNGNFTTGQVYTITKILTIDSSAALDGWILESAENSDTGGTINNDAPTLLLGDNAAKRQYRSILSFNTGSSLPDTAVITKVMFKVKQQGLVGGGDPLALFQGLMISVKYGFFGTAAGLQTSDFDDTPGQTYGASMPTLTNGFYTINLTSATYLINKTSDNGGLTQIRLRFKLDDNNDTVANYLSLYSGSATAGSRPQLVITYSVP